MEAPDGDWVSDRATLADASVACSRWLSNLRGKQRRRNSRAPPLLSYYSLHDVEETPRAGLGRFR